MQPSGISVSSEEEVFLQRGIAIVEAQMQDEHFGPEALAEVLGVSLRQLRRRLGTSLGEGPAAFIRRLRLERAAQLLDARAGTVAEIAYRVGFSDPSNFARAFRAHFGHSPSEHIQERT